VRIFLLAATFSSRRYTRSILGTHEVNLLYKHKNDLETAPEEDIELLRAAISNTADVKPGWFLFRVMEAEDVPAFLLSFAIEDGSDEVRIGALDLLTKARIKLPEDWWPLLPLHQAPLNVRQSAFEYFSSLHEETALRFLEGITDDNPLIVSAARDARFEILVALHPEHAFAEILEEDSYLSKDKLQVLFAHAARVKDEILIKGTEDSREQIRRLSLEELIRRGSLSTAIADKLTKDASLPVRAISYGYLAVHGTLPEFSTIRESLKSERKELFSIALSDKSYPDVNEIILIYLRQQGMEDIQNAVEWYSSDGPLAYRVLATDHFDNIAEKLRSDLVDGFERLRKEAILQFQAILGSHWESTYAKWKEFDDFIKTRFTEAALLGLAEHAQPGDADLARPYLAQTDDSLLEPAVAIVSKVGNPEDVPALIRITKEAYGSVRESAASAAIDLSNDPVAIAHDFLLNGTSEAANIAYKWLVKHDSGIVMDIFKLMLVSDDEKSRLRAVNYVSNRLQPSELEQLLNEYLKKDAYYYNIVTWLDRLLYSPPPLREIYAQELEKKAY